jgi:hypothetical protein
VAFGTAIMENPLTGQVRSAPIGFSWTTFFFGPFPALFRSDYKWAIIILILALITFGVSNLAFIFMYNKLYFKELIANGFKVKSIINSNADQLRAKLQMDIPLLPQSQG